MHFIAPIPIIIGCILVIAGFLWLVSVGSEEDGGPDTGMFILFGGYYLTLRILRELARNPGKVLPGFGILIAGGLLIWLGAVMW